MPSIHVCSLARLGQTVEATGARHILTLINAGTPVDRPASVLAENHVFLGFNDIVEPVDGMTLPGEAHVARVLDYIFAWDRADPVIVHCFAGVSRSTAGAFAALCALRPDLDERLIARRIRARSPEATPNSRFVALADAQLRRNGRMVAAVAEIGRGVTAYEGTVFGLSVDE
jgi:predicted protein tyrosine phosphatase